MKTTIDALVEALEACTTEEGPTQEELTRARAALAQARAEQAEPESVVAWRWSESNGDRWFDWTVDWTHHDKAKSIGCLIEYAYTTPPAAPVAKLEPLSDEEIWAFWCNRPEVAEGEDDSMEAEFVRACRAAIAAHNAKLGGAA